MLGFSIYFVMHLRYALIPLKQFVYMNAHSINGNLPRYEL